MQPWAESVASTMLADVDRRSLAMWKANSAELGSALRRELDGAPTGQLFRNLQQEQVRLIKSIPLSAAKRVHELTNLALTDSTRAAEIAKEILSTQGVTESKAMLIARTEVSRAQSNLLQARAEYVGSVSYIWRTSRDGDVRDSHREMEGKQVFWSDPPTLDKMTGHAGALPNCRCYAEPIFTDN